MNKKLISLAISAAVLAGCNDSTSKKSVDLPNPENPAYTLLEMAKDAYAEYVDADHSGPIAQPIYGTVDRIKDEYDARLNDKDFGITPPPVQGPDEEGEKDWGVALKPGQLPDAEGEGDWGITPPPVQGPDEEGEKDWGVDVAENPTYSLKDKLRDAYAARVDQDFEVAAPVAPPIHKPEYSITRDNERVILEVDGRELGSITREADETGAYYVMNGDREQVAWIREVDNQQNEREFEVGRAGENSGVIISKEAAREFYASRVDKDFEVAVPVMPPIHKPEYSITRDNERIILEADGQELGSVTREMDETGAYRVMNGEGEQVAWIREVDDGQSERAFEVGREGENSGVIINRDSVREFYAARVDKGFENAGPSDLPIYEGDDATGIRITQDNGHYILEMDGEIRGAITKEKDERGAFIVKGASGDEVAWVKRVDTGDNTIRLEVGRPGENTGTIIERSPKRELAANRIDRNKLKSLRGQIKQRLARR